MSLAFGVGLVPRWKLLRFKLQVGSPER